LILENRNPQKTIAWILVLLVIPVIGLLIYFYLGQNWKKKQFRKHFQTNTLHSLLKKRAYYARRILSEDAKVQIESPLEKKMINNIKKSSNFGLTSRNNIKFFFSGSKKIYALTRELKKAKKYIHMEYYRVRSDRYGDAIRDILIEKAQQGVEVKILLDFLGSIKFLSKNVKLMRKAGVDIHSFFNPLRLFNYHKLNYRTHRKIAIIDGKTGFIGGMNIGEEYVSGGKKFSVWKDCHMMLEGEIVHQLQTIFLYDWYLTRKESIIKKKYYPIINKTQLKHKVIQAVHSGPESIWSEIKQIYFLMITNAEKHIWMTTPFFIPDESMINALKNAALSGVDVKIIVPSVHDQRIPLYASRTYFQELLDVGVQFYEYMPGFMHAKAVIADSKIASVGSANFDIRTFDLNFEANVVLYSNEDVKVLESEFKSMLKDCKKISPDNFKNRSNWMKIKESLSRLLSPIL